MKKTYKDVIISLFEKEKTEMHIDDIYKIIEEKIPNYRKSENQYLREFLTNRYKGSDLFYQNGDYFGLKKHKRNTQRAINIEEKYYSFRDLWTLAKVKDLTLEQYTQVGNKDTFTYWVEKELESLGSIWGGSAFKFGVFHRDKHEKMSSEKGRMYNEKYAWYKKYGNSPKVAFEKVKSIIIKVIEFSQQNNLKEIEKLDLGEAYKWKIAFHYQNISDPVIINVFKKEALVEFDIELFNKNLVSSIHKKLKDIYKFKTLEDVLCLSDSIWSKYKSNFTTTQRSKGGITKQSRIAILEAEENTRKEMRILARGKNSRISRQRKEKDSYTCKVCNFHYKNMIVESHHLSPIYLNGDDVVITSTEDLITLCPTCHRLAHNLFRNSLPKMREQLKKPDYLVDNIKKSILSKNQKR